MKTEKEIKVRLKHLKIDINRKKPHFTVSESYFIIQTLEWILDDKQSPHREHSTKDDITMSDNSPRPKGGFYRQVIKHNYPKGFQVLCMNCNMIKAKENKEHWTYHKSIEVIT